MLRISFAAAALVAGFGVLAAPAIANAEPFANCTAARDAGYENIPSSSDYYGEHLDRDLDGIGASPTDRALRRLYPALVAAAAWPRASLRPGQRRSAEPVDTTAVVLQGRRRGHHRHPRRHSRSAAHQSARYRYPRDQEARLYRRLLGTEATAFAKSNWSTNGSRS